MASVSNDGTLRIWDVRTIDAEERDSNDEQRRLLATFHAYAGNAIAVTNVPAPDGREADVSVFMSGHADGRLRLWDWKRLDAFVEGQREYQTRLRERSGG